MFLKVTNVIIEKYDSQIKIGKRRLSHSPVLYYCIYNSSIKRVSNKLSLNIHLKNPNCTS